MNDRKAIALRMADGLGITLYLREDGTITQHPPGEEINPRRSSQLTTHNSFNSSTAPAAAS